MIKKKAIIRHSKSWYVLLHLEPELIERQLQAENEERRRKGLRLLEYFIPYQFLPKAVPDEYALDIVDQRREARDANDLRRTMHHFVFIKASSNEITRLVNRPWNREGRLHLFFYITRNHRRIKMPESMMESFITLCCENKQRFTFGPPIENIADFDTVVIAEGSFKDTEAKILDVQHTTEGISVTLGIPFFNGEKTLKLPGIKPSELHLPLSVEALLSDRFIDHVEDELIAILDHRVKHPKDHSYDAVDAATLNHLFHYSYVKMPDRPSHCRFRALMLICATLRLDSDSRTSLIEEISQLLRAEEGVDFHVTQKDQKEQKGTAPGSLPCGLRAESVDFNVTQISQKSQIGTAPGSLPCGALAHSKLYTLNSKLSAAYAMAALYIATGDADYRTAAKTYQQEHADSSTSLTRLLSPIKRMNKSFFKSLRLS